MAIKLQKIKIYIPTSLDFVSNVLSLLLYNVEYLFKICTKPEVSVSCLAAPTSDTFPHLAVSTLHCTVLQWLTVTLKDDILIIATSQHLSSLLSSFTLLYPNAKIPQ